jgi:hypothetical protein
MPSRREQERIQVLFEFVGDPTNLNRNMAQIKKQIKDTVGGGTFKTIKGGNAPNQSIANQLLSDDDTKSYLLRSENIRARTVGLRYEVGRLRNILLLVSFAAGGVIASFKAFFEQAVRTEASLNSLRSVAANTGLEFERLKNQSIALENEGIMSVGGSTSALKNLAASRLSMTETSQVMNALTDAAAFNRQGQLSWEEAVIGATQGIKNQNSIMIDNAGITKNISVMYREYALQLGKTSGKLTENEKRQAIVNGIIREAGIFAGDAERAMNSYQGRISKFNVQIIKLQRSFGELVAPGIIDLIDSISDFLKDSGRTNILTGAISVLMDTFKELVNVSLRFLNTIDKLAKFFSTVSDIVNSVTGGVFKMVSGFTLGLVKLGLFVGLSAKLSSYFNNIAARASLISKEKMFDVNKSFLMNQAAIQSLGITGQRTKQDEINIQKRLNEEILKEKDVKGSLDKFLKQGINDRAKELAIQSKTNREAAIELQILRDRSRLLGFNVNQANFGGRRFVVTSEGEATPKGFKASTEQVNRLQLGMRSSFNQIRLGMIPIINNMKTLTFRTVEWKTSLANVTAGFVGMGRVAVGALTSVLSAITKIFGYFMIVLVLFETIRGFLADADAKAKALEQARKNLELERRSASELSRTISQLDNKMASASNNLFALMAKNGQTLSQVHHDMSENWRNLNKELTRYNELIKTGAEEEKLTQQLEIINTLRSKIVEGLNLQNEALEAYNESLEGTIELFKEMSTANAGSFGEIFNAFFQLQERLEENRSQMIHRSMIQIPQQLGEALGLQQGQFNAFHALNAAAEQEHQLKIQKITLESEKKIADIQKQIRAERLKGLRESLLTELLEINNAFESQRDAIQNQIREAQLDKVTAQWSTNLMRVFISLMNQNLQEGLSESRKNVDLFLNEMENLNMNKSLSDVIERNLGDNYLPPGLRDPGTIRKITNDFVKEINDIPLKIKLRGTEITGNIEELFNIIKSQINVNIQDLSKIEGFQLDEFVKLDPAAQQKVLADVKFIQTDLESLRGSLLNLQIASESLESKFPGISKIFKTSDQELNKYLNSLTNLSNEVQKNAGISQKMALDTKLQTELNENLAQSTENINAVIGALNEQLQAVGESLPRQLGETIRKLADYSDAEMKLQSVRDIVIKGIIEYGDETRNLAEIFRNSQIQLNIWNNNLEASKEQLLALSKAHPEMRESINKVIDLIEGVPEALETKALIEFRTELFRTFKQMEEQSKKTSIQASNLNKALKLDTTGIKEFQTVVGPGRVDVEMYAESLNTLSERLSFLDLALNKLDNSKDKIAAFNAVLNLFISDYKKSINELALSNKEFSREIAFETVQIEARTNVPFLNMFFGDEGQFKQIENERISRINSVEDKIRATHVSSTQQINELTRRMNLNNIDEILSGISEIQSLTNAKIAMFQQEIELINQDSLNRQKEAWFDYFNSLFSGFSQIFSTIGDVVFQVVPNIHQEQAKSIEEQDKLLRKGEISQLEHGKRITEINKFYAEKINNIWLQTFGSVAQGILQMMSRVFESIAAAAAVKSIGDAAFSLGSVLTGIGAAAPWLAVAGGLAFAGSALGGLGSQEPEFPEFEGSEGEMGKFGGTIKAEEVSIVISPTFIIEGEQVFIGSGSVVEYTEEATELFKQSIQQAIDNRELNLDKIKAV